MAAKEATEHNQITEIKVDVDSCLSQSREETPEGPVSSDSQEVSSQQKATENKTFAS